MIELSILMPLFNAKYIAWLGLESLCRQQNVPCDWELVICEEQNDHAIGEKAVLKYSKRLDNCRCKKIKYIPINQWINLSRKYIIMLSYIDSDSKIIVPKGADNYSQPYKIRETYDLFGPDIDIVHTMYGYFYDIGANKTFLYDHTKVIRKKGQKPGLAFAFRRSLLENISPMSKVKGNDSWMYLQAKKNCIEKTGNPMKTSINKSTSWKLALYTRGLNNLSDLSLSKHRYMYSNTDNNRIMVPKDIMEQLAKSRTLIETHIKNRSDFYKEIQDK